jgi:hypothetical protein
MSGRAACKMFPETRDGRIQNVSFFSGTDAFIGNSFAAELIHADAMFNAGNFSAGR